MSPVSGPKDHVPPIDRLSTGQRRLDEVLGGGFVTNSFNVVMGAAGSGKTILLENLIFSNARLDGRKSLYLATLSEPLDRLVRYLQQFDFYREGLLGSAVVYESLGEDLAKRGINALVDRLRELIVLHDPQIIVIDSFKAIHELSPGSSAMRLILFELAGLMTAFETTCFLVGEYEQDQVSKYPEFAVADGIVQLTRNALADRDERYLRVLKLRGSDYQQGQHAFVLSASGIIVYPRLVSPAQAPAYIEQSPRVLSTGVEGLDRLLCGGIETGRCAFITGPTGSGKSTVGYQFVAEGLRHQEHCVHLSLEENPTRVASAGRSLGFGRDSSNAHLLRQLYFSPVELRIDAVVDALMDALNQAPVSRVVIDAVGDLLPAAGSRARLRAYLYALGQNLAVRGITCLMTHESPAGRRPSSLASVGDIIVALGVHLRRGRARRSIRVVKARSVGHDMHQHALTIDGHGAHVL